MAKSVAAAVRTGDGALRNRRRLFLLLCLISCAFFIRPLVEGAGRALDDDRYSHVLMAPLLGGLLLWNRRDRFPRCPAPSPAAAGIGFAAALAVQFGAPDNLAASIAALLLLCLAACALCYGVGALGSLGVVWIFLIAAIPLPPAVMDRAVIAMQAWSATLTEIFFGVFHIPAARDGYVFTLADYEIEIAKECGGIRSTIALLLTAVAASDFLRNNRRRGIFVLIAVAISLVKNAVRIVAISLLGVYVDRGFFYNDLHQYGGLFVSALGLLMMSGVLLALVRAERSPGAANQRQAPEARHANEPLR